MNQYLQAALVLLTMAGSLAGCGGGDNNTPTSPTSTTPTVASIAISGYSGDITGLGQTVQLRATASMSNGQTQDVTNTATWASDVTGVARVSATGVLTSVSAGDATITATSAGVAGRQRVTVKPPQNAVPSITGNLNVRISPELRFLYRAELEAQFRETGGGAGYSVNFVNVTWKNYQGQQLLFRNYNPNDLRGIWGSNYVRAGGSQGLVALIDYNQPVSTVSVDVTISIGDDFGNQRTFTDTFRSGVSITAPAKTSVDMNAPAQAVH